MPTAVATMADPLDPVRFSRLKLIAQSPAHYRHAVTQETTAMERGTALHALVLGGKRVIAYPGKVRRGKEWDLFQGDNADALILTETEHSKTFAMAAAVRANEVAMTVLDGRHEVEVGWSYLGRTCGSRLDVIGNGWVTELKTCAVGHPDRFAWNARKMGYHVQLAAYMQAVTTSGLGEPKEAYVVAVESSAPYVVTTMRLTERALDEGRRIFRLWFERLLACEAANAWPGYVESIVPLDVPEDEPELTFGNDIAEPSATVPF